MSKPKFSLTENGVCLLYDVCHKGIITMQVIFLEVSQELCYLRLSDGKYVSPVVVLVTGNAPRKFGVGGIIAVKATQLESLDFKRRATSKKDIDLKDKDLFLLVITNYTVVADKSEVDCILGSINILSSYKDAIRHIVPILKKYDPKFKYIDKNYAKAQLEASKIRENGNSCFHENDYESALAHYDTAKGNDPYDYRLWSNSSRALFHLQEYEEAEEQAIVAIKVNPFQEKAYFRAGQAALKQGKYAEAMELGLRGRFLCGDTKDLQILIDEAESKLYESKEGKARNIKNKKGSRKVFNGSFNDDEENVDPNVKCSVEEDLKKSIMMEEIKKQSKEKEKQSKKGKAATDDNCKEQKKIKEERPPAEEDKRKQEATVEISSRSRNLYHETLKDARRFYETNQFRYALEVFGKALAYATPSGDSTAKNGYSSCQDFLEMQFLVGACMIHTNNNILDGMDMMKFFSLDNDAFGAHASAHYFLGLAYEKLCLNRMAQAQSYECSVVLNNKKHKAFKWPGSDDIFPESDPERLKVIGDELYRRNKNHFDEDKSVAVWKSLNIEPTVIQKVDNISDFSGKYTYMEMVIQNSIEKTKREFLGMFSRGEHSRGYRIKVVRQRGDLIGRASTIKPTPKAKCRFKNCILTQGHPFAREEIYDTNPDFKGFVDVMCEEFCSVAYHPCCWKAHKEDQFGKMSDKDFLGTECVTPDCTGKINGILIHDETGTLKHEILLNKRDKKNSSTPVKQKKKKDKKKTQPAKQQDVKDKKKPKHESLSEDFAHIEETTTTTPANAAFAKPQGSLNDCQNNIKQKTQVPVPPLPIDPESLDKVAVVIKPMIDDDLAVPTKLSKKKKKNKKSKEVIQPDLLGDPLDTVERSKSEYVARLRILKQQREAQESDAQNLPRSTGNGFRPADPPKISQWLDPENPFYLPQHLQDNPEELERILQTKMIASTSPNLDNSAITTLLEFVYGWLKAEGPMSINDDRLRQYVAENFPQDALNHVNHCGGIKQFLMQSIDFAMIDEVICVRDHVVRAQDLIRKNVAERMMSSKFLISDGRKAKKFSHLLDDTKSSCSSSSSTSLLVGSGVSSLTSRTTSESLNPVLKPLKVDSVRVNSTELPSPKTKQKSQCVVDLDSFTTDLPKANLDHDRPKNKFAMEGLSDLDSFEIPSPAIIKSPSKILHSSKYSIHTVDSDYEIDCEDVDGSGDDDDDEAEDSVHNSVLQKAVDDGPVTISQKQQTKPVKEKKDGETRKNLPSHLHLGDDQGHSIEDSQDNGEGEEEEEEEEEELEEQEDFSDVEEESEEVIIKGEIEKMKESMRMLIEQNQKLNDKLIQVKSSTSIEISSLKQKVEEQKAEKRELESEKHSLFVARESEARKFKAEMCRMQEEVKSFQGRHTSLEHKYERTLDRINELDGKLIEEQEIGTQLREDVKNLQESLSSSSRRAHEAEVKYLCIKKDLADSHLNRTIDRLTEEVVRMRQLLQYASEDSIPDHATISRSIIAWDESIKSLRECKAVFLEEAKRLLNMVNQGRPLNALPPGDLSIPAIPEMNIARLLSIVPNAKKLVQNCVHELAPERQYACGSPAMIASPTPAFTLEPQIVTQKLQGPPGFEPQKPLGLPKIVPALAAFSGGAIPKGNVASGPKVIVTETDAGATQKYPDSHKLFIGKLPWESTESDIKRLFSDLIGEVVGVTMYDKGFTPDGKAVPKYGFVTFRNAEDQEKALKYGPIMIGNHVINVQAKEARKPTKPLNLAVGGPSSAVIEPLIKSGPLAYGLSDISLNATSEANKSVVCTLSAPTVPKSITSTFTKPKFQNLTTTSSVGTIGTLPPKLVRPQPKQLTNGKGGAQSVTSAPAVGKEDSGAYKRLIEVCKQRIGKEYSSPDICSALREVRMKNSNSLSGMNVDHIVDSVKQRLRARRPASGSVAPWAGLTQGTGGKSSGPEWQGLPSGEIPPEEQCSICLDALNLSPTLQLQCHHVFHEKCISGWLKRQSNCPNCRTYALMDDEYPSLKH
ncbi:uncharacterized protein LOC135201401 isoform X2 [Macrobrachium nipponense]